MSKALYIPKGTTQTFDQLTTENIVVDGELIVHGLLCAKHLQVNGRIQACQIQCLTLKIGFLTANIAAGRTLAANQADVDSCCFSAEIICKDFLKARLLKTGKLSKSLSSIEACNAEEIVYVTPKRRGMLGMLLASAFRSFCTALSWKEERGDSRTADAKAEAGQEEDEESLIAEPSVLSGMSAEEIEVIRRFAGAGFHKRKRGRRRIRRHENRIMQVFHRKRTWNPQMVRSALYRGS